jgi:PAS domain S-box-containing protein
MSAKNLHILGLIALVLALATLVANAWFLSLTAGNLQRAYGEADRVLSLLALNGNVLDSLRDAETGQRGFLLTGREDYLKPYDAALGGLPADMSRLAAGFAADKKQSARISELQSLVDEKLRELAQTIELRRSAGEAAAIAVVMTNQGKQIMDRIRQISHSIQDAESARLATALDARQRYTAQTQRFVLLGSVLLASLVCGAFVLLRIGDVQRQRLQTELARAEVLETTLHSIGDGVIITDRKGVITLMNPVACGLAGCGDPDTVRGIPLREVFHIVNEYTGAELENPLSRVIREGVVARLANHAMLVSKDGSLIPIDDSAAPIRHGGELVGAVLVFRDIRERRRAEQDAAYMAAIVQSTDDAIIGKSLDEDIIQSWNGSAERVYGYRAEEIIGHRTTELVPVDRQNEEADILAKLRAGEHVEHFETVRLRKGGELVDVSLTTSPIRNEAGRIIGASQIARDISRQKRAERQLRASESKLRAYLESAAQGIVAVDARGRIEMVNAKAEEMFGYSRTELTGEQLEILVPERLRGVHLHHRADYLAAPRAKPRGAGLDLRAVRKDGTEFPVEIALNYVPSPEGPLTIALISDITERKKSEEQLLQTQKFESLGVLAGGIAHDFNNLLTGILGNASLTLSDLEPGSPARKRIADVIDASERAAQLTRQMLAYAGKGRFVIKPIDLSAHIRETLPLTRASVPPTVELRLDLAEQLPAIVGDSTQIQQLIMNIVINGAEAIPEGRPGTVTITTRRQDVDEQYVRMGHDRRVGDLKPGLYVLFEVSDTGAGMNKATMDRMFDPFFTTKFTGRGLGLAAVLGIVRANGGCVRLTSTVGQGTEFGVLFPAVEQSPEAKPGVEERKVGDLSGCGTILVVDDEEIIQKTARQVLERHGYEVLLAENGARGLEIFRRELGRLRCVVLDMTMPVMSGEETLARMKSLRADVPIVLSSGYSEAEAAERFAGKGLAGFLQKPYKADDLAGKVREIISRAGQT